MTAIKRVFIANRGEIARRIALSARRMGIETVCIRQGSHTPAYLKDLITEFCPVDVEDAGLYLNQGEMIRICKEYRCDALHPGFGFLSENAQFAKLVSDSGIIWIGPSYQAIEAMASKSAARELASKAQVPCVPGMEGIDGASATKQVSEFVDKIGLPVLLKAALGGGGKGMRVLRDKGELASAMERASSEAQNSFGDGSLIVEKYLETPRHVEVQILGDQQGNVRAIGDRDCSVQRRHQKVIEEAPAPFLHPETRRKMHEAAVNLASEVGYYSAGTVEFLVDSQGQGQEQNFYFLEMNTRLQVEHPVTEEVFKTDLVAWQFKIASGEAISPALPQQPHGHSIEARIYAEDPNNDYFPAPGKVHAFHPASHPHVRWEIGLDPIDEVSGKFDPMIAKVVATGDSREQAIRYLKEAVSATILSGPIHNMELIGAIMDDECFQHDVIGTQYLSERLPLLLDSITQERSIHLEAANQVLAALADTPPTCQLQQKSWEAFHQAKPLDILKSQQYSYLSSGYPKRQSDYGEATAFIEGRISPFLFAKTIAPEGVHLYCKVAGHGYQSFIENEEQAAAKSWGQQDAIPAPVPGKVIQLLVKPGDSIAPKQTVAILESMKMEFEVQASFAAMVESLEVETNDQVDADQLLIKLKPLDEDR